MKKLAFLAAMTLAAFVAMVPLAYAGGMEGKAVPTVEQRSDYIGALVKNLQGDRLGFVRDVVADDNGEISFVIVSHGGFLGYRTKETAIPFQALTYRSGLREFDIDLTREKLDSSPRYVRGIDLNRRGTAEAFYRFYGITPPWGESKDEHMKPEEPMKYDPMKGWPMDGEPVG